MIRKAKPTEIDEILAITQACGLKMASENIFQWDEGYPNKEAFEKDLARDELYVMLSEEDIIACITISSEKDSEYNTIAWLYPRRTQLLYSSPSGASRLSKSRKSKTTHGFCRSLCQRAKGPFSTSGYFQQKRKKSAFLCRPWLSTIR